MSLIITPHTLAQLAGEWNVSTAVFIQAFSVAAQEPAPQDIFFKPDGLKMYVIGSDIGTLGVHEYDLSVAWDVSTAVFLQTFSVATQESIPQGVFFKPDGLKMYVIGISGDDVNEYNLSMAWDVSTAAFLQTKSIAAQEGTPTGIFFKPDGLKMYVIGADGNDVNEYDLSGAWDVSTVVFLQTFSIAAQEGTPTGVFFKSDGLKMYAVGTDGDDVNEYDLSVAWNVSTAVFLRAFSVVAQETDPRGIFFKPDGLKMYIVGNTGNDINEYNLGP